MDLCNKRWSGLQNVVKGSAEGETLMSEGKNLGRRTADHLISHVALSAVFAGAALTLGVPDFGETLHGVGRSIAHAVTGSIGLGEHLPEML